jgi:preprotein translocase subunit YajC
MNQPSIWLAQTTTPPPQQPAAPQAQPPIWANPMFFLLVVMGVMFWWMSRNQKKQREARQKLLDSVKTGDKVVTSGGIHGVVANVKDKTLIVKIADNVKIEVNRSALDTVESRESGDESAIKDIAAKK